MVDRKIVKERLQVCSTCPNFNKFLNRCNVCKCFLNLKALLEKAKCPEGKWKR